jgi:hypothetical protein
MACNPLIADPFGFPRRGENRPGLPRIAYRIGRYADFVEAIKREIDAAPALAAWTHRDPDDPGIALIEGAAILGDILSFYQEHYANEAYLRTAAWRESVAELVRLTGYRLAPGIGGRATFAFTVKGADPVTIRAGFPVKAELADVPLPADFQTDAELLAYPHLSRFNLYRSRIYASIVHAGATVLELTSVAGATDSLSLAAFQLKKGDRLMLVPSEPFWTSSGSKLGTQQVAQVVKVGAVTSALGRTLIEIEGAVHETWYAPATAYRLGRAFRHFGHNAPPNIISNATDAGGTINGATQSSTTFDRHVYPIHDCINSSASVPLPVTLVPLDQEVNDLSVGAPVVVETRVGIGSGNRVALTLVKKIAALRAGSLGFGNLTGPTTFLTLDSPLIHNTSLASPASDVSDWPVSDVRDWRIHETTSPVLTLRPAATFTGGTFANGTNALRFYGTGAQAQALAGRRLHLEHADGRHVDLVCTNHASDFGSQSPAPKMWPVSFDRAPTPFLRSEFDETKPTVTVYGNVADASQGKAEREAVLGNGDNRQSWQTFPLPKSPLTYFLSNDGIPPQTPELEIWVGGRLWSRVDAFFDRGPAEEIYIVREDADGRSFVQFGDGVTGMRLPSGVKNVHAVYRTGDGARGPIKPGATPSASERPNGFDKVALAGIVTGGADPEDLNKAREAAPGKVQSLGRLVSIRDYETETLAVPGVVTATAAWDLHAGVPAVILRVLLEAGREAEFSQVRAVIAHAQRCHGPDRFPVVVEQAFMRYAFLDVVYARDPTFKRDDVEAAMRAALSFVGDTANERTGLFGLRARRLGEREYASSVEGRLQNVAGILWCRVAAFGRFAAGISDVTTLVLPAPPRPLHPILPCSAHELLQIAPAHLALTAAAEPSAGECA